MSLPTAYIRAGVKIAKENDYMVCNTLIQELTKEELLAALAQATHIKREAAREWEKRQSFIGSFDEQGTEK